jgi:hypothetical protein
MDPLTETDAVHLEAAEGWLDLGNHREAAAELERVTPAQRGHPNVLHLRWRVHAAAGEWEPSLKIAEALTAAVPERRCGWVRRGFTLRKLNRHTEAMGVYQDATHFPGHHCRENEVRQRRRRRQRSGRTTRW